MPSLKFLVVALKSPVQLFLSRDEIGTALSLGGTAFREVDALDFTGFYDWLRTSEGEILGVRYSPFEGCADELLETGRRLEYTQVEDQRSLLIFFSERRTVDTQRSVNQDFGGNRVFVSVEHLYALTFNADRLSDRDVSTLRTYGAELLGNDAAPLGELLAPQVKRPVTDESG